MTDAERQQRRRDRQKAGLVRIEVWVPKQAADFVLAAIEASVKTSAAQNTEEKGCAKCTQE